MLNSNNIVTKLPINITISDVFKRLLLLEPLFLLWMVYAFWYPIEIRYQWLGLLIVVPVFMIFRLIAFGRLFTHFPLDTYFIIFIILCILNLYISPFTAAAPLSRLYLLGRPLLGVAICIYFVEHVRIYHKIEGLLLITLLLVVIIGTMALLSSNWNFKSSQLNFILNSLPRYAAFPGAVGGFNVNEIAGGLAWTTPLCAGLMCWRGKRIVDHLIRWGFGLAFLISFAALFLGQSRSALIGVLVMLVPMTFFLAKRWRWRIAAWILIGIFIVLELLIVRNAFTPPGQTVLTQRDESSVNGRLDIWNSALHIVRDYPFTGAGMNMFREKAVRNLYPVTAYDQPVLPHAHNEFLQIAADLGIPGLILFVVWYVIALWNLLRVYRKGETRYRALAVGIVGSLFAHIIFGMGDAVAIWDRLAFLLWWMFALTSAAYWLISLETPPLSAEQD